MSKTAHSIDSKTIDDLTRRESLSLSQIRSVIPRHLLKPVAWKSWLTLFRVTAIVAACLYLLSLIELQANMNLVWQIPALIALWMVYGANLVGYFLIGHDCGHNSFTKNPTLNKIIGTICMAPIFNGYHSWKLTHDHHHAHTQVHGQDVDWSVNLATAEEFEKLTWRNNFFQKLGYSMPFGILIWIGFNAFRRGANVEPMIGTEKFQRERAALLRSNLLMALTTTSIYLLFWYFTGFWGMLKFHAIPVTIASFLGAIVVAIGHANENMLIYDKASWTSLRGQLVSTYDYRFPVWLEYLMLNINIHIPHHVSTKIPWYNLKEAGRAIREAYPEYYQERPFDLREMAWIGKAPLLLKNEEKGYYEMVPRGEVQTALTIPQPAAAVTREFNLPKTQLSW